jgi:hypothetical protein
MNSPLLETLVHRRLVCDGAMGTQLMLAGLAPGACGEAWNLTHPDRVLAIQRQLRRSRRGLPDHQHLWRQPAHPRRARPGRPGAGDQRGGCPARPGSVSREARLRPGRRRPARRAAGTARGTQGIRCPRRARGADRRTAGDRRGRDPFGNPDRAGGTGAGPRRRARGGRAVHHRFLRLRPVCGREEVPHHDGRDPGACRAVRAGAGRAHPRAELRQRHGHARRGRDDPHVPAALGLCR